MPEVVLVILATDAVWRRHDDHRISITTTTTIKRDRELRNVILEHFVLSLLHLGNHPSPSLCYHRGQSANGGGSVKACVMTDVRLLCSVCRRSNNEFTHLLTVPGVAICDDCLGHLSTIMAEQHPVWGAALVERLTTLGKPGH
jgi:ClpX C4-type zinc finger